MSLVSPINVLSAHALADVPTAEGHGSSMTTNLARVTVDRDWRHQHAPQRREVVAGVDTHANTHHVAVLSLAGARLGDLEVPATPGGYLQLIEFIASFGTTRMVGVEGTSSYGTYA